MTLAIGDVDSAQALESDLMLAAQRGACDAISRFLAAGGSLRSTSNSATHEAVFHDQGEFLSALLAADPGCDRPDWLDYSAFDHALERNRVDLAQRFLAAPDGAALLARSAVDAETLPLHAAAGGHALATLALLLGAGCTPDGRDRQGRTALMIAAGRWAKDSRNAEKTAALDLLMAHGAEVNAADVAGKTPLHHACAANDGDAVRHLVGKGASPDGGPYGNTPFLVAMRHGACDAMRVLYDLGVRPDLAPLGETVVTYHLKQSSALASDAPSAPVLATLLELGFQPDEPNAAGERPLDLVGDDPEQRAILAAAIARRVLRTAITRRVSEPVLP